MARRESPTARPPADKPPTAESPAAEASRAGTVPTGKPCPICGKQAAAGYVPFCSKRCADVDLHRWLGGVYAVPTEEQPETEMPPPDSER